MYLFPDGTEEIKELYLLSIVAAMYHILSFISKVIVSLHALQVQSRLEFFRKKLP